MSKGQDGGDSPQVARSQRILWDVACSESERLQEGMHSFHAGSGVIRFTPHKDHSR